MDRNAIYTTNNVVACRPFVITKPDPAKGFAISTGALATLEVVLDFKPGNDAYPELKAGAVIYVNPELRNQPESKKRLTAEGVQGEFIFVPASEIRAVKPCSVF